MHKNRLKYAELTKIANFNFLNSIAVQKRIGVKSSRDGVENQFTGYRADWITSNYKNRLSESKPDIQ